MSVNYYEERIKRCYLQFRDMNSFCGYVSEKCRKGDKENYKIFDTECFVRNIRIYVIRGERINKENWYKSYWKDYTIKYNGMNSILCRNDDLIINKWNLISHAQYII